ncbi:MAG: YnbE family lipoprotein [Micavibrio aeruginosavorus]|uniref:YnbE family lipoprotein n=1 Tax=Micavibrio aeruginosavorus TaxID=349221 RepID=A0A2W5HKZ6_9BACT|nr:MAG: YnbE family lipoprotein [Micavibrio aeruginosavorus]
MKHTALILSALLLTSACTPTVKLEAPDKPIEINMNVKIEQEVRVRVDRDLDKEIMSNPELFGVKKK